MKGKMRMFIKKYDYIYLLDKIKNLESLSDKQQFELFVLKNEKKYNKCSLPNGLARLVIDGVKKEEYLLEFMLLANKKGIDTSQVSISKYLSGDYRYQYIYIVDNKAEIYFQECDTRIWFETKNWSEIRKCFVPYIED